MEFILNFIKTDNFYIGLIIVIFIMFILYLVNIIKLSKLRKSYSIFMKKIGNGQNIQETLEKYIDKLNDVQKENTELKNYCKQLDNTIARCIQKVGLVRYNAFKDTGSDLSFTLALLNEENTGVVLNGIYSREMSNIYSKPVEKGTSSYTLSEEEKQAINKAINM
ncbi:MAG: DUF4446 family protein [Clostridia bacterium]|nr:DUF4446 family protein [Clostridia bacterium]